jgi:hypothetical protein
MEKFKSFNTKDSEWSTKIDAIAKRLGVEPEPEDGRSDGQTR